MKNKKFLGNIAYRCDIGKVREINEDRVGVAVDASNNCLLVLADGMGGHKKGDFAANILVDTLLQDFKNKSKLSNTFYAYCWLVNEIKAINKDIYKLQDENIEYKGMGTTLTLALIIKDRVIIINAGDSRCYFLKNNRLEQMTEDQTYVRYLVKSGQISEEEALTHPKRHYLINAIGLFPSVSYDIKVHEYRGESIFLCSDGLYNNVSLNDIEANLNSTNNVEDKVNSLINLANFNGGNDNISCILWESIHD